MNNSQLILSICTRCRDGREQDYQEVRGGERMAKAILARQFAWKDFSFEFRGEAVDGSRGGTRLAQSVVSQIEVRTATELTLRGVQCMSQCKRPYIAAFCGHGRFSYLFGDLDPEMSSNVDALLEFPSIYLTAPEGFVERRNRPMPLQKGILARLPPPDSTSKNVFSFSS